MLQQRILAVNSCLSLSRAHEKTSKGETASRILNETLLRSSSFHRFSQASARLYGNPTANEALFNTKQGAHDSASAPTNDSALFLDDRAQPNDTNRIG